MYQVKKSKDKIENVEHVENHNKAKKFYFSFFLIDYYRWFLLHILSYKEANVNRNCDSTYAYGEIGQREDFQNVFGNYYVLDLISNNIFFFDY